MADTHPSQYVKTLRSSLHGRDELPSAELQLQQQNTQHSKPWNRQQS
jgi:hypothetical protein